jgi:hypothetical protein
MYVVFFNFSPREVAPLTFLFSHLRQIHKQCWPAVLIELRENRGSKLVLGRKLVSSEVMTQYVWNSHRFVDAGTMLKTEWMEWIYNNDSKNFRHKHIKIHTPRNFRQIAVSIGSRTKWSPIVKPSGFWSVNTLRTGLLNCLNARSRGLTFKHRASCI